LRNAPLGIKEDEPKVYHFSDICNYTPVFIDFFLAFRYIVPSAGKYQPDVTKSYRKIRRREGAFRILGGSNRKNMTN